MTKSGPIELKGHTDRVWNLSWHPSGHLLASSSSDKQIRIWKNNNDQWELYRTIDNAHSRTVRAVKFSPNGKFLASCGFDGTSMIWNIAGILKNFHVGDGECIATLEGHENEVKSISWSASGTFLATCGRDKTVWIWEIVNETEFECYCILTDHTQDVKAVQFHPVEHVLLSASYDDTIRVWRDDGEDWYCDQVIKDHSSTIWDVAFSPNGNHFASVSDDQCLKIFELKDDSLNTLPGTWKRKEQKYQCIETVEQHHSRPIYSVDWSTDNAMITGGGDNRIKIYKNSKSVIDLETESEVNCVAFHPIHPTIFASAGDDGIVRIWSLNDIGCV